MRLGETACYLFQLGERRPVFGVFRVTGIRQLGEQGLDFSAKLIRIDVHCVLTLVAVHQRPALQRVAGAVVAGLDGEGPPVQPTAP